MRKIIFVLQATAYALLYQIHLIDLLENVVSILKEPNVG